MVLILRCKHCGTVVKIDTEQPPEKETVVCKCPQEGLTVCSGCKKKYGGKENGSETSQALSESN